MIETPYDKMYIAVGPAPEADATSETPSEKTPDEKHPLVEADVLLVKRALVTSSLRKTRQLLKAQGRFTTIVVPLMLYCGIAYTTFVVTRLLHGLVFMPLAPFGIYISSVLATLLVAPSMMLWTHLIITKPSPGRWARLTASRKAVLKVLPATAVWALAKRAAIGLPLDMYQRFDLANKTRVLMTGNATMTEREIHIIGLQSLAVIVVFILSAFLVFLPATVTLTRVQASLLPETEETLVPFDRSFDGRVVPESEGGSGKLGLLDAWRTFDWAARGRLLKLFAKVFAIETSIIVMWVIATVVEIQFIMSSKK